VELPNISDEHMQARLAQAKTYTLMILRKTDKYERPAADPIVREHGRRNMALQESGLLNIVCPVADGGDLAGIGVFAADIDQVRDIYDADPGVQAGIFSYEVHSCRGFPGSSLAG